MKIIFMGTAEFAIPALCELINSDFCHVVAVFTAKPKQQGRGLKEVCSPVHELAVKHEIPVYTPNTLKTREIEELISSIEADVIVVAAYGLLIPKTILYAKKYGSINIHPSDLPKYRGAAPLQRAIINGEEKTAVCIMQMDEGFDTGDIILKEKIVMDRRISLTQLHDLCAGIGANLLIQALKSISSLPRIAQNNAEATYAYKLTKEESKINWLESAYQIDCKIRAMNPWPGVYFEYMGKIIKILEADSEDIEHAIVAGTVMDNNLKIACGSGFLIIKQLQQASKKSLSAKDFLLGFSIPAGSILV